MSEVGLMPTDQDEAVAEALGMSDAADDAQGAEQEDQAQEATDVAFEELPESWREEIRRLRRENAAQRVARRDATKTPSAGDNDAPAAPSAQALRAAENRGKESARMEYGVRLAGAEVRAALTGLLPDEQIADVVEDINLSRFVLDDGEVDRDLVKALRDKYASIIGKKSVAKVGHGQRNGAPTQKSNADKFGDWLATTG